MKEFNEKIVFKNCHSTENIYLYLLYFKKKMYHFRNEKDAHLI